MTDSTAGIAPLVMELPAHVTTMDALHALCHRPRLLLLESSASSNERGRYSFLMASPLETHEQDVPVVGQDPLERQRAWSDVIAGPEIPGLPPFQGGIAGLMSYELGGCWERVPTARFQPLDVPSISASLYPWVIAWDHLAHRVWLIVHGWPERQPAARQLLAEQRAQEVLNDLRNPQRKVRGEPAVSPTSRPLPAWALPIGDGLWSDFDADGYRRAVGRVVDYIHAGDIFQANLSQRLLCPFEGDAMSLYQRLRSCNPAPFSAWYEGTGWSVISASPERFFQVRDRVVSTRPIKGTRRRSARPEADLFTRDSLLASDKDRAENTMIVDLLRNDLSRVCQSGSVHVPQLCLVETYATVQHLVSEIRGTLEPDQSVWDLFAVMFPGGSITGAPKIRAMEIIAELEPTARGPYTGSLFCVGPAGTTDSNLLIRTFVKQHNWLYCGVGGGIVAQSDPQREYEETWHKASGMLSALGRSFLP